MMLVDSRSVVLASVGLVAVAVALFVGAGQVGPAPDGAGAVRPRRYFEAPASGPASDASPSSLPADPLARSIELERRGDLEGAAEAAQAAVVAQGDRDARLQAGKIAILRGALDEAEVWLRPLLSADPDDVDVRYDLALVAHRRGEIEAAQHEYEAVLRQRPDHADARYNLAVLHRDARNADAARREAARFAEQHPGDARVEPLMRSLAATP